MIYTHKRKASKLQIFQVRNSTPSAGVRPSLCEDVRQRDAATAGTHGSRRRGASRGRRSISNLINKYLWSSARSPSVGACPRLVCNPMEQ